MTCVLKPFGSIQFDDSTYIEINWYLMIEKLKVLCIMLCESFCQCYPLIKGIMMGHHFSKNGIEMGWLIDTSEVW